MKGKDVYACTNNAGHAPHLDKAAGCHAFGSGGLNGCINKVGLKLVDSAFLLLLTVG